MKISMNANIMKTQFFRKIIYDLKCHSYVMEKFCDFLRHFLQIKNYLFQIENFQISTYSLFIFRIKGILKGLFLIKSGIFFADENFAIKMVLSYVFTETWSLF